MSVLLALLASALWGVSDFLGGSASRRLPVAVVLGGSQAVALLGLLPVAALTGAFAAPTGYLAPALLAGAAGMLALAAFYRALATGTMGVVAPVAALGVVVPVVFGVLDGEQPSLLAVLGIGVAGIGVVLASGPQAGQPRALVPVLLAALAALGFGLVLVLLARGAETSTVMTLLVMRLTSVTVLGAFGLALWARGRRPGLRAADLPLIAAIGAGDVGANGAFAVASTGAGALVSVTGVLASLYPVVTVLLARWVLAERLRPVQVAGASAALLGVVLLAAG